MGRNPKLSQKQKNMTQPKQDHILQLMKTDLPEDIVRYDGSGRPYRLSDAIFYKEVDNDKDNVCNSCAGSGYDDFTHTSCVHCEGHGVNNWQQLIKESPMYNPPTVEELQSEIDRLNDRVKDLESQLLGHHKSYFY